MIDFIKEFKPYYDSFIQDLKDIISYPSVLDKYDESNKEYPFGKSIREVLDYMVELGKKNGFKAVNEDNYYGFLEYGEGDKTLLILCHLDVVPATGKWDSDPFTLRIDGNKVYGRGVSDDKGPLLATFYALKMLKDNDYKPNMKIRFFFGCDEESGSRCLERYYEKYGECDYGFSPDADYPCIFAEKGISGEKISGKDNENELISFKAGLVSNQVPDEATAKISIDLKKEFIEFAKSNNMEYKIENDEYKLFGKAAHGSIPQFGINAATYLASFLNKYIDSKFLKLISEVLHLDFYGEKGNYNYHDEEMGDVSANPAIYNYSNHEYFIITNIRYPKDYSLEDNMVKFNEVLKKYDSKVEIMGASPCHYIPKHSHLVSALLKAYRDNTGDFSEPISIGGGTYARDFKNAVAFGCQFKDDKDTMHMPNEEANIESLIKSSFIIKDAILNICD